MKPQAITFFDLDGTLLNEHSQITPAIAEAMAQLKRNNVLPVIATGRTNPEIEEISQQSGISSLITMNGQYIQVEGAEVYSDIIATPVIERMLAATKANGHQLGFYNHRKIRVTGHTENLIAAYEFIHSPVPIIDEDFYLKEPINMLLVLSEKGPEDEKYLQDFPELRFFRNGPHSIDTIAHDGSKGHGVKKLLEVMGYEDVPTYGFGDGPNDLDLLNACDVKIAMGNAQPQLKALADFVTKENTQGGIIHALQEFKLL